MTGLPWWVWAAGGLVGLLLWRQRAATQNTGTQAATTLANAYRNVTGNPYAAASYAGVPAVPAPAAPAPNPLAPAKAA